jgi:bifunctional enzyme CysN/CysC
MAGRAAAHAEIAALTDDAAGRRLLRVLTCGSVDDGKSTLIGRLLHECGAIFEDQRAALENDSKRYGTTGESVDFALLLDGLEAEREQGITIDVAYRYFATGKCSFIVADTPGHEQYTRNMATGASNSDAAIILVDARKGVLAQTRRHAVICSLLGIRHVVLAVNKMDLVGYAQGVFDRIAADFRSFASPLSFNAVMPIPISARFGDNVIERGRNMAWHAGPALLEHLEAVEIDAAQESLPFRFPVQWVNRPDQGFRGFAGTIASGRIRRGDAIRVARNGAASRIARILAGDEDVEGARAGDAVTLTLGDELDIGRGDLLVPPDHRPEVADQFAAHLIWMSAEPLLPGRSYLMRIGTRWVATTVSSIKHKLDINHLEPRAARILAVNEIGLCNFTTATPVAFDSYESNRETGAFIIVDRYTNETVGAGMIVFGLRRATNIHPEHLAIEKGARAWLKHQRPCIVWFTGLSASGKSTVAKLVEAHLHGTGHHTYMLDGDNVRHGLNNDLGFTDADRVENIRRVGEVAKLFVDAGLIVLCAFISPFRAERQMVRDLVGEGEFIEVFVDTPIEECRRRDPKGLYAKVDQGRLKNFTGVDSPYEPPQHPDLVLRTRDHEADELARVVVEHLRAAGSLQFAEAGGGRDEIK